MPGVTLVPYPIQSPELGLAGWWHDPGAFAFLLREYGKYLLTTARLVVARPQSATAGS
jgi:hypothetical protein